MKNKVTFWILLFTVSAAVICGVFFLLSGRNAGGVIAKIYSDGELLYTIDLNSVTEAYEFTVKTERGENTILVEPGQISVSGADCPDRICVLRGSIPDGLLPIVCLPHRLVIETEEAK